MITQAVHGGGTSPTITRRVYYIGTDTLLEGYALCYNFDASDVSAENLTLSAGVAEECPARRIQVEKPSVNNCAHFAGTVSNKSAGVTGPGWIEINLPGSVCNIYAYASADHGTTGTGMNTGQMLTFVLNQYYFMGTGLPGAGSAIVLQDVDRSSTAGLVMAELCIGAPSGGIQNVSSLDTAGGTVVSTGGIICIAPFGVTILNSTALTAKDLTAALTCCLVTGEGAWVGQRKLFRATTSLNATHWAVTLSTAGQLNASAAVTRAQVSATATFSVGTTGVIDAEWNGTSWQYKTNLSSIVVA